MNRLVMSQHNPRYHLCQYTTSIVHVTLEEAIALRVRWTLQYDIMIHTAMQETAGLLGRRRLEFGHCGCWIAGRSRDDQEIGSVGCVTQ